MSKTKVFYFNPTCELAVANGSFSYMPPLLLQEMERDLALLPFVFASENDFIISANPPSAEYIQQLKEWGFEVPGFCSLSELEAMPAGSYDVIFPWGWSPAAHFKLKNLKEKCSGEFKTNPVYNWHEGHQSLFERSTSLNFLTGILNNNPQTWLISKSMTGVKVTNLTEIESMLNKNPALVLKAPMSSSGRGIQIIRRKILNNSNKEWISGVLKQQNYLIAEPFLEKLADLSFQFQINDGSEIEYLGYSFFETNSNGQYKGSFIHAGLMDVFPGENADEIGNMIGTTAKVIGEALKISVYLRWHRGFLGVDAMFFRNEKQLMMQPCIEINCRMNMGILTLFLESKIQKEAKGKFELYYGAPGEFEIFAGKETLLNPPVIKDGKISSGFFPLVEPGHQKKFGAYFSIGGTR
ncbi:MAG: hypothetical protein Q8S54_12365 [Bacteroidota bacterium]|nr:hypothetical protein [Odoribacter sp.]MDP3643970.1 hypothetical protein [Bacteroidota bacterium]